MEQMEDRASKLDEISKGNNDQTGVNAETKEGGSGMRGHSYLAKDSAFAFKCTMLSPQKLKQKEDQMGELKSQMHKQFALSFKPHELFEQRCKDGTLE